MKIFLWYLGKGFQASGMGVTGYALLVGLSTSDIHAELEILLSGVFIFVLGMFFEKLGASA